MNWRKLVLGLQTTGVLGLTGWTWPTATKLQVKEEWNGPALRGEAAPPVSIVVPARNEALNIEACLRSLLAQEYPDFDVVVVDDGSQDATPQIIDKLAEENSRLKVVHLNGKLPEGWAGKPHAMYEGVCAARLESVWLLFTDADTRHQPLALSRGVSEAVYEKVDLFSVLSRIEMGSFWEKLLMPIAIMGISVQYPLEAVNSPDSKIAIANGQFLLVRRAMYDKVGGFGGRLRNSILDDRDMALAVKAAGGRLLVRDGRDILSVRMYQSLGEIWAGWRKNAFVGSRGAFLLIPFAILSFILMGVLPFLQLPYAMVQWLRSGGRRGGWLLLASVLQTAIMVYSRRRIDRAFGLPVKYSVLNPLGFLVFAGILADSMWRSLTGQGVSWKGRQYQKAAKSQQMI